MNLRHSFKYLGRLFSLTWNGFMKPYCALWFSYRISCFEFGWCGRVSLGRCCIDVFIISKFFSLELSFSDLKGYYWRWKGCWIFVVQTFQNYVSWEERSDYVYYSSVSGISAPLVLGLSSLYHWAEGVPLRKGEGGSVDYSNTLFFIRNLVRGLG